MTAVSVDSPSELPWFTNRIEQSIFDEIDYGCVCAAHMTGADVIKLTATSDPRRSLSLLQIDCWTTIEVSGMAWLVDRSVASRVKAQAHEILNKSGRHLRGDWYDVPRSFVPHILALACARSGTPYLNHEGMLAKVRSIRERRINRALNSL